MLKNLFKIFKSTDQINNHNQFWSGFEVYTNQHLSLEKLEANQTRSDYYGFILKSFEKDDAHLTVWKRENDDRIGVFVVLQNRSTNFVASDMFDKLEEYREVIETTLKVEDEWKWFKEPPFPSRGPMIGFYRRQTNEDSDYKWIVERLETLNMGFFMTIQILRGDAKPRIF